MLALVVVLLAGCLEDEIRTCSDLGCPYAPSGAVDVWTPCESDMCYCAIGEVVEACTSDHGRSQATMQ